ncbi:hypothetical protein SAMN05444672_10342 [Bacillus sp. OK838]|nr:hypothetical protein SAMN05444672_10342 [Bacillus sp. OK838]
MYGISFTSERKAQWWLLLVCKKHFGYNLLTTLTIELA